MNTSTRSTTLRARLGRLLRTIRPVPSRLRWLRSRIDPTRSGLEIGPCHNAVAPKRLGYRTTIVDHLDQCALQDKYRTHGFDISLIEEVDRVWSGEPLPRLLSDLAPFSWVVASHVAEHVPDLLRFLQENLELLAPEGRLVLALPDHRRCFDARRHPSSLAQVLDAWARGDTRPTAGSVAEHHLKAVSKGGRLAWSTWWIGGFRNIHSSQESRSLFDDSRRDDLYRDVHVWCFTPDSFAGLIGDLTALGLLEARIVEGPRPRGYEFLVVLSRT